MASSGQGSTQSTKTAAAPLDPAFAKDLASASNHLAALDVKGQHCAGILAMGGRKYPVFSTTACFLSGAAFAKDASGEGKECEGIEPVLDVLFETKKEVFEQVKRIKPSSLRWTAKGTCRIQVQSENNGSPVIAPASIHRDDHRISHEGFGKIRILEADAGEYIVWNSKCWSIYAEIQNKLENCKIHLEFSPDFKKKCNSIARTKELAKKRSEPNAAKPGKTGKKKRPRRKPANKKAQAPKSSGGQGCPNGDDDPNKPASLISEIQLDIRFKRMRESIECHGIANCKGQFRSQEDIEHVTQAMAQQIAQVCVVLDSPASEVDRTSLLKACDAIQRGLDEIIEDLPLDEPKTIEQLIAMLVDGWPRDRPGYQVLENALRLAIQPQLMKDNPDGCLEAYSIPADAGFSTDSGVVLTSQHAYIKRKGNGGSNE